MRQIHFLHILKDDKFVEPVMKGFAMEEEISSEYIYYNRKGPLKFIKKESGITIYNNRKDFIKKLKSGEYDVLYLHSMQYFFYLFLKYIPKDKILVWWEWGYDIYGDQALGMKSFVNMDFYMPQTQALRNECMSFPKRILRTIIGNILSIPYSIYRKYLINRVDYFQPVRHFDYELMKVHTHFRAKEFYRTKYPQVDISFSQRAIDGAILIGNSASPVNNHVDIWKTIESNIPVERNVIVPLSYGSKVYGEKVKQIIRNSDHNFIFLDNIIPRNEYFSMIDRCSYAVYGSLRQHAMGNISFALRYGIKVFLYKKSPIYSYLISAGFKVFAIEDVDNKSFNTPLSFTEHKCNILAYNREVEYRREVGVAALKEISSSIR